MRTQFQDTVARQEHFDFMPLAGERLRQRPQHIAEPARANKRSRFRGNFENTKPAHTRTD